MKKNGPQTPRSFIARIERAEADERAAQSAYAAMSVRVRELEEAAKKPIPLILTCPAPKCGARHIDEGEWATRLHHTHSCQICGFTWRPAVVHTVGVQFLPGFRNTP